MVHENAYERGTQKAIPAVLVYVMHGDTVLMVCRGIKSGDFHAGKWNGLGGKLEEGESPWDAAIREVAEESGLRLSPECCRWIGTLTFPNFKPKKREDWVVFVFVAEVTNVERSACWGEGPEGPLVWISKDKLLSLPLWEGDRQFLPLVLARKSFVGTFCYENGRVTRYRLESLS